VLFEEEEEESVLGFLLLYSLFSLLSWNKRVLIIIYSQQLIFNSKVGKTIEGRQ